jgi:hypothetical protein
MLDGQRRRKTIGERRQRRVRGRRRLLQHLIRECPRIIMLRVRVRQRPDQELQKTIMAARSPLRDLALRRMLLPNEAKWLHVRELRIIILERVVRRIM